MSLVLGPAKVRIGQLCYLSLEGCIYTYMHVYPTVLLAGGQAGGAAEPAHAERASGRQRHAQGRRATVAAAPVYSSPSLAKSGRRRSAFELVCMRAPSMMLLNAGSCLCMQGSHRVLHHKALWSSVQER